MKFKWIKIVLLILAIFPMWLTIVAMGGPMVPSAAWRDRINTELLKYEDKKIQVVKIGPVSKPLDDAFLTKPFRIDLTGIRPRGLSVIKLIYQDEEGRLSKIIKLSAKLHVQELVPVAAREMSRGQIVNSGDFKQEWRDASTYNMAAAKIDELVGRQIVLNLRPGKVISENSLRQATLVNKGDRIRISVVGTGISLSTVGIAEESGARGQTIRIRNIDSRKKFYGRVKDSSTAEVSL